MHSKRQLMTLLGIFAVAVAVLGTLLFFKVRQYRETTARLDSLKQRERRAKRLIAEIPKLRKQVKALSNQVEIYAEILPKEQEVQHEAFVETMDRYARETGLRILRADPILTKKPTEAQARRRGRKKKKEPTSEPAFEEHRYLFDLVGTFPDFLRFLNKIENWDRFLAVEEMEIRPYGTASRFETGRKADQKEIEAAQKPLKTIQLVVTTYTYKPKKRDHTASRDL